MPKGIMYVDNIRVEFNDEPSVLAVCQKAGVEMPNFCFHSDLSVYGACRMCMVEDEHGKIDAACTMLPKDGLRIRTNTARLLKYRRTILELLLASHCRDCTTCEKNRACRLQEMAMRFGIHHVRYEDTRPYMEKDETSPSISVDYNKCILCGDCVRVCHEVQGVDILHFAGRGPNLRITTTDNLPYSQTKCVSCGQCSAVCTTGAITIKNEIGLAWKALHDPQKRVVIQIAPAVRVALGEAYGLPSGENVLDKLVTALKIMGADEVYDTIFGADLTVREEGPEFLRRLESGENLPLLTSCCPAWVKYVENTHPQFLKNLSSALSPMQMFATVLKDRYQKKDAEDGRTTYHIAIMPCTAKKMEAGRPEFRRFGTPNVDLVLTTQEVIKMIKESGIRFQILEKEAPDLPFGMGSGAAEIFGTTGGVAEAVVRFCLPDKSKNALRMIEHSGLRGSEPVRFATIRIGERDVRIAVAHGLRNAGKLLDQIERGEVEVDLVEVMACPTGCVGGAGQPYALMSRKLQRASGLYEIDRSAMFKRAERNPVLNTMYAEDLGERSHELLHQTYSE
ncbi:MAG: (2Fe-2S)-binding protein [Oscillospiraceae bacterium]|nr:(2Fe-2S)-binding protein [Oscillospiraceae bacterium]MBQ2223762.1 (2Fe-2S)-binding protein [Oscillospiraceae bacterium]